ncbi:MAG: type 4 fimbrial biosis protein PilE [Pseudomonadota bacterium]
MRTARSCGFTLIELMVVVVIVALLATVAYPSFVEQIRRSGRAEARAALMEARAREEQYFLDNKTYTEDRSLLRLQLALSGSGGTAKFLTESGKYDIQVDCSSACMAYTLSAVPQGAQEQDRCGTLTLTSEGVKGATDTNEGECW